MPEDRGDAHVQPAETDDDDLVDMTVDLADRALARLKREATLPEVAVDPRQVAATLRRVQSRVLWAAMTLFAASATLGILAVTGAGLADWYMHVGMYIVIFSFFVIYLKAHLAEKRFSRHLYAVLTTGLMLFFAVVLHDLVPPREVLDGAVVVIREAIPWLDAAAGLLVGAAVTFALHWIALRTRPNPDALSDAADPEVEVEAEVEA
jgi:hypothetical protein